MKHIAGIRFGETVLGTLLVRRTELGCVGGYRCAVVKTCTYLRFLSQKTMNCVSEKVVLWCFRDRHERPGEIDG